MSKNIPADITELPIIFEGNIRFGGIKIEFAISYLQDSNVTGIFVLSRLFSCLHFK